MYSTIVKVVLCSSQGFFMFHAAPDMKFCYFWIPSRESVIGEAPPPQAFLFWFFVFCWDCDIRCVGVLEGQLR